MTANTIVPYQSGILMPPVPTMDKILSIKELVKLAAQSGMVKASGRTIEEKTANAFFIAMYGLELGIPPMTALRTIFCVGSGAPTCSGEAMLALIRRSGKVKVTISSTEETLANGYATVHMKRLDSGDEFTARFGKEDMTRAGMANKDTYKSYPAQMWTWRAVSIAAKALCSDIVGGLYTVDEIYPDTPLDESGNPIGEIVEAKPANIITQDFSSDGSRRIPPKEQPQIIVTDGTSALQPAPEIKQPEQTETPSPNGTHSEPPSGDVSKDPQPSENNHAVWQYDYQSLMKHGSITALYPVSKHRANVLALIERAKGFDNLPTMKTGVERVERFYKLTQIEMMKDEDAIAAMLTEPEIKE